MESKSDWREEVMNKIRKWAKEADPDVVEEIKYRTPTNPDGVFVWYHDGMITTGETYKKHLRLSFTKGPQLKDFDPTGLINTYRAIIIHEEDTLDESAFKELFKNAVKLNIQAKEDKKQKRK